MKSSPRNPATAFTMVEVLIALAILGLIVTAIYASWTAVLRASKSGLDAAAAVQRERIARQALETALSSALLYGENVRYYAFNADTFDDKFATVSFVARLPDSFPGSGLFPGNPVRRVTFAVEAGTNGGNNLVLRQQSIFLPTNTTEEPFPLVLAHNVGLFGVEFWDTNLLGGDWASEWLTSNQVPKMVRVTLGFGQSGAATPLTLASSVIAIPAATVTKQIQFPDPQGGAGKGKGPAAGPPKNPSVDKPKSKSN